MKARHLLDARPARAALLARATRTMLAMAAATLTMSAACHVYDGRDDDRVDRGIVLEDQSRLLGGFVHNSNVPLPHAGEGLAGAAWLDYDNDDDLDLYLPNGKAGVAALFRNDGDGTFTDVAAAAGVANTQGSSGVVVGDLDNNGYADIFLTGEGHFAFAQASPTVLYMNNGDGTFRDITATANIPGAESSLSAAMGDINNDGYLDIFIASPGHLDVAPMLDLPSGAFGGPAEQHKNTLYLNNGPDQHGNVSFTDISAQAGIDDALGACVVSFSDHDQDGWLDIFVGNCNEVALLPVPWNLYRNNGDLTFTDIAPEVGLGDALGYWMATALGDYDNDGDIDLFGTNFGPVPDPADPFAQYRKHSLFRRNGNGTFTNVAPALGLSEGPFGWGATFADFDNDGHQDLYFAGSMPMLAAIGPGRGTPGRLFFNDTQGGLDEAPRSAAGVDLSSRYTSGVARGDYDGDGFVDLIVMTETQLDPATGTVIDPGTPVLLHNRGNDNRSLTVRLVGTASNAMGIGARIDVIDVDMHQVREVYAGSSFASSESPWPTFGLGKRSHVQVWVTWPSGVIEFFGIVEASASPVPLVEGQGLFAIRP